MTATPFATSETLEHLSMFIDGKFVDPTDPDYLDSVNPFTGRAWAVVPQASDDDVDRAVQAAHRALSGPWGSMSGSQRATIMRRLATLVERDVHLLATIESTDNGKLLRETTQVAGNLPRWINFFAGSAERLGGSALPTANPNFLVYTRREPIGVVAAIVPWNAPLMLFIMKVAPALAAGCTLVVKTAEQTTASALAFARLAQEAGLPDGVLNIITGEGRTTGRSLVRHPLVAKVSFTGSTAAGVQVMQDAAEHLAPVTLELGGKSANIVFADSDLDAAANGVIASVFAAAGQMCIAGGRLLVESSVRDELVAKIAERASRIRLGDPFDVTSEMGPLATREQLERVLGMIAAAQSQGAHLLEGGHPPDDPALKDGFFIRPTIFTDVTADMDIAHDEVFGPVLAVFSFETEDEAIELANDTRYGLAGGVWTTNLQRGHRVAARVKAGTVWLNAYRATDPAVPFGGMKDSGFGRENGDDAVLAFTETKAVWVELSGETRDPFIMG
ncbi:aldehyde dehydrogenase [soil metagenome]